MTGPAPGDGARRRRRTPEPSASAPAGRRAGRGRTVLVVLVLALAALAAGVPVWLRTAGTSALRGDVEVTVTGTQAAPGVPAAALVLLAAGVAVGLAGRVGRWVVVAVVLLAGLLLSASALALATDPTRVARSAVAAATGVDTLAAPVRLTPWPWVAAAVGGLVLAAGCWLAVTSRTWARPSDRHDRHDRPPASPTASPSASPAAPAVTHGVRPQDRPDHQPSDPPSAAAPPPAVEPDDDQAAWDALTRGHDPT